MEKIWKLLKENKFAQSVAIAGGISAAALMLYFSSKGEEDEGQEAEESRQPQSRNGPGTALNAIQNAIAEAKIISIQGHQLYDLETACRFQDIFVQLAIPEFRAFAMKNRKERREALATENEDEYLRLIMEYNDGMLGLIGMQQEKLKEVSEEYSEQFMSVSISVFMKEIQYQQKIIGSISTLKASLGSDLQLTIEDGQEIIAFFVQLIKTQPKALVHLVKSLISDGKPHGMIYPAFKTAMYDQLYLERGFEEEDYLAISLSPEFNQQPITQRLQQAFSTTVNQFIDYHSS